MKKTIRYAVSLITGVILALSAVTAVFADDTAAEETGSNASRITIEEANISFVPPSGWSCVDRDNMSKSALDVMGKLESTVTADFESNNGYFYGVNSVKSAELYITCRSDSRSQKIYNSMTGDYSLISEYLNNPSKYKYLRYNEDFSISRTSTKLTLDNAVFYLTEYTYGNVDGLCYSTVVNGEYISFDFRKLTGKFSDGEKITVLNTMKTVKILNIEEKETLDQSQIVIIGGVVFLVVLLFGGIIAINKKKKR